MEDPLTGPEDVLHGAVPEARARSVRLAPEECGVEQPTRLTVFAPFNAEDEVWKCGFTDHLPEKKQHPVDRAHVERAVVLVPSCISSLSQRIP